MRLGADVIVFSRSNRSGYSFAPYSPRVFALAADMARTPRSGKPDT